MKGGSTRCLRRRKRDGPRLYPARCGRCRRGRRRDSRGAGIAAPRRSIAIEIVRTGSRGLYWLEPMVEVATAAGRVAYGPVTAADVAGLLDAGLIGGGRACAAASGRPTTSPGSSARRGSLSPAAASSIRCRSTTIARMAADKGLIGRCRSVPQAIVEEVIQSGLRGRGGAGFPTGIKWRTVAQATAPQKYIVCNADEGDSGTFADRMIMEGDPFVLIEGMAIAGIATGATKGYVYIRSEYPHAIAAMAAAIAAARCRRDARRKHRRLAASPSTSKFAPAPAPMSAAKKPRCWKASKASAGSCARSRRCRRIRACSASRPSSTTCCRSPPCR